jgi:signal transduction histidine kinase
LDVCYNVGELDSIDQEWIMPTLKLRTRLFLTHIGLAILVILVGRWSWWGALGLAALWSLFVNRSFSCRLRRLLKSSQVWLRGNLALRVADPRDDEVGRLADNFDVLIQHLEEDEEDLALLRERNARLTDQVRALAVVEERNRLARELHDSVKQQLFSLAMTASAVRARLDETTRCPADVLVMIQEIEAAAQAAQKETTRLIADLRPGSLQEQGLIKALNDYTLLLGAREHLLIHFEAQGNDAHLPPSTAEGLYRVAQEALHNAARHARASRVDVHLRCLPEYVLLTVEDNGVGFDLDVRHAGLGVASMRERMLDAGGRLTIESEPGKGTTVRAEVVLSEDRVIQADLSNGEWTRPQPHIENWAWLGQKLVIPVDQVWPWHPADLTHLRTPLVEPNEIPLRIRERQGWLGIQNNLVLERDGQALLRLHQSRQGYEWELGKASWSLRAVLGAGERMVLRRNDQPLAALQDQGRQMHTWTEVVYDDRGYRLDHCRGKCAGDLVLAGECGEPLAYVQSGVSPTLTLQRTQPLPLLAMVAVRAASLFSTYERSARSPDAV